MLFVLILAILLGGLGFLLPAPWVIAAIVLVGWLADFALRVSEGRRRWCRWCRW